jgi:multiple sugar transport system permease protein
MPSVVSGVVVALVWRGLFNEKFGVINWVIGLVGLQGPDWFNNAQFALGALIIISVWSVGGGMIIYLAGLQSIPTQLYEAAEIDGCSSIQKFSRITIPMMTPVIFFNLIMGIISCFQYFTEAWTLTRGGPAEATQFYNIYIYKTAFSYQDMGYGSALAWVLFFIVLVLSALVFKSSAGWVHYESEAK